MTEGRGPWPDLFAMVPVPVTVPFTPEWRAYRLRLGDEALAQAQAAMTTQAWGSVDRWTAIAQAHYMAANIRGAAYRGSERGIPPLPHRLADGPGALD